MKEKAINSIRVERAIHQITQGELAVGANMSRQTIHAIETGKFNPSIENVLKIIRFLNELKRAAGLKKIIIEDVFNLKKETI